MNDAALEKLRAQIDDIDEQLLELFNRRAACAVEVADVKRGRAEGADENINYFRPDREAQVIKRLKSLNQGPLSDDEVGRLIREVMSACLALERPLKIAYLGPEGTFTESAALKHFGHSVTTIPMSSIPDVFNSVESGHADYGLVPVENSTEGVISHTLDMFIDSYLKICGEVEIPIHHHLANRSQDRSGIRHIYSHQQSFAQCRRWLDQNLPGIERIPVSSNAEAARLASAEEDAAAICGRPAVEIFDLKICYENIEDLPDNTTRFVIIGKQDVDPSGNDKTSLLISTRNEPGALLGLLQPLADHGISMNKIESRPAQGHKWAYVFFIDIDGHQREAAVIDALKELKQQSSLFKILGSYPESLALMSVVDSALEHIRQLHPYSPGKPIEELERELGIRDAIKLASNENPLGCSPQVQAAIDDAARQIEFYPDANAWYLKQDLARRLGISENQITIGNGSNDVLDLVARCFLDQGTEAIYSQHAFMVYAMVTQACGARGRAVPAASGGAAYGHDLDAMQAAINADTRVIFIANPNNPTGTWLAREPLEAFLERVPGQVAVVIDEAYFEYVEQDRYPDALRWLARFPNLIVTRTFSKIYGLAGLRLGYAVSSAELCELLNRVRQPFNANSLALAAARRALADDAFVARSRDCNRRGLRLLREWCEGRGIDYIPSVGNFLSVEFGERSDSVYRALMQRGVIVRPIANYELARHLRISVGTEAQLARLFEALEEIL